MERYIYLKINVFNDFVSVQLKNNMVGKNKWKSGMPVSKKSGNHGIGLINVDSIVKKYNGSMILEEKNNEFQCNIIFCE